MKKAALKKSLVKDAIVIGGSVAFMLALMAGFTSLAEGALASRSQAEAALSAARGELTALRTQIDKSGNAEKRYAEIRIGRVQENYTLDTEMLKEQLRILKEKYRLTNSLKLTLSKEKKSDNPLFATLNDDVVVSDDTEIIFGAMSDIHAFSFANEFVRSMPGIVRLTKFVLSKKMGMDVNTLSQMTSGAIPEVATVEMHFLWAGVQSKAQAKSQNQAPSGAANGVPPTAPPGGPL